LYRSNRVVWFVDKGTKTDLSGKSDRWGKIELAGALRDDTVAGVLPLGKSGKVEKVRLKKTAKPHGSEKPQMPRLQLVQRSGVICKPHP
jgi:hypothetical protein